MNRGRIALLAVPIAAFAITANIGNALAPTLITNDPILLLVLAPRIRWLIFVSAKVGDLAFYGIPMLRASAILTTYFLLGRWYGDRAIRWMEDKAASSARPLLWIERKFYKARYPIAFFFPGNLVAILAGASDMAMPVYLAVALSSIAIRLVLIRYVAHLFEGPLLSALDWIADYQIWLTVASVAGVFIWSMWSSRNSLAPIESIEEFATELDQAAAELEEES